MNYRPARWVPPSSSTTPVICDECGSEDFTVFYISQILGRSQCETCLRMKTEPTSVPKK